jgi:hypothetical protein
MAMHEMSKWILRVMIVLGAIGFGTIYVQRNGWTIAEVPMVFDKSSSSGETEPVAAPGPSAVAAAPAAPAASVAGAASPAAAPCQPIGRTGRGELVYSMDCQRLPQPAAKK